MGYLRISAVAAVLLSVLILAASALAMPSLTATAVKHGGHTHQVTHKSKRHVKKKKKKKAAPKKKPTATATTTTPTLVKAPTTTVSTQVLAHPTTTTAAVTPTTTATAPTTTTTTATTSTTAPTTATDAGDTKTVCVYPAKHISLLQQFDQLVGTNVNCVMAYNDAATDWSGWDNPWFLHTYSDMSWGAWASAAGTNRQLVITQNLFPSSENNADWLDEGAAGDFEQYATTLAQNLVNAGLGNSIIRLAHEANGNWYPDSIPDTTAGDAEWVQFWDNTVTAMRAVPGAHFKFDWTVNVGYRNIPLADWYPGDNYVDIIGMDVYDVGYSPQTNRWQHFYTEGMGVQTIQQFAAAHDKPLSVPEWGIDPASPSSENGGGDDPAFIQGIANLVANNDTAYQSYFFQTDEMMQLEHSPNSISAYQQAFGANGYAVNSTDNSLSPATQTSAPTLTLVSGPAYGSTISSTSTTFTFQPQSGYTPLCSLDGQTFRACSSATSDVLTGLSSGFHEWDVELMDANEQESLIETDFIVSSSS